MLTSCRPLQSCARIESRSSPLSSRQRRGTFCGRGRERLCCRRSASAFLAASENGSLHSTPFQQLAIDRFWYYLFLSRFWATLRWLYNRSAHCTEVHRKNALMMPTILRVQSTSSPVVCVRIYPPEHLPVAGNVLSEQGSNFNDTGKPLRQWLLEPRSTPSLLG